jgi:putative hydrolase of HD superfamily
MNDVCNFLFEMGQLRRIKHEGWRLIGIQHPESIADHSLRAAQIGYILASLQEYPEPEKVCTMLVFHDIGESRIGDIHRVANRYIEANEEKAVHAELDKLGDLGKSIMSLWKDIEYGDSIAGKIAKDADFLEMALTAREYLENGYLGAQDWLDNISKSLKTAVAKEFFEVINKCNPMDWWKNLKKL